MASTSLGKTVRIAVVLNSQNDWDEWFQVTRTTAKALGIWDYIDPTKAKDKIPVMTEPPETLPSEVDPIATAVTDLDTTGRDLYKIKYQRYLHKLD